MAKQCETVSDDGSADLSVRSSGSTLLVLQDGGSVASVAVSIWQHKEGVKTENDHINLKVAGQDGSVVQFKIKRHTPLSKLMKAYCERQGLSMRQIRFRFDGQPINETDTPAQVRVPRYQRGEYGFPAFEKWLALHEDK
ncbi:hypothetical protein JRQ81_018019 [Phrynocephalus forsythii]|uniref:Ubiquitin-like domain-containing protein n=1 Tax=Phrynocephalus forsythii TaxID=171643 RepID=A0A9Q0XUQ7_9SAUR|nr:hypothetical protein JRQ81_018019 [Phrynocephalus forsythii]